MTTRGYIWRFAGAVLMTLLLLAGGPAPARAQAAPDARQMVRLSNLLDDQGKALLMNSTDRALAAGVPAEDVGVIVQRGLARGSRVETLSGLLDTAASLKEKGLPVRPVLDRTEQGLAKGVPPETVAAAARRLGEKLAVAQPMVSELIRNGVRAERAQDREMAIDTVARALERSIGEDTIARTGERVRERKGTLSLFDQSVHTITRLTDAGVSQDAASRLVHAAVERGKTEKDLAKMERSIAEDLKKGKRADEAARSVEQEIKHDRQKDDRDRSGDRRDDSGKGSGSGSGKGRESGSDRTKDSGHSGKGKN